MMKTELLKAIKENKLMKFYKSREWRELRLVALERDRYECRMCKSKGKYRKAECVHHVQEVKVRPDLALTLDNLMCLCNSCHNIIHDKVGQYRNNTGKKKFMNEERW